MLRLPTKKETLSPFLGSNRRFLKNNSNKRGVVQEKVFSNDSKVPCELHNLPFSPACLFELVY